MRVLGITSANPGEGKTVFALNLALTLRESVRSRVLLIEANLRTPIMAKMLGFTIPECFIVRSSATPTIRVSRGSWPSRCPSST